MRRLISLATVALLFAGGAAACSSDSNDTASSDTTEASTDTTTASTDTTESSTDSTGAVPAGAEEFCGLNDEMSSATEGITDPQEFTAAASDIVDSGGLDQAVAAAPADIADEVAVAADGLTGVADGSLDVTELPDDMTAASQAIDDYCGGATP